MSLREIKKLISLGEGFTLEFKKSSSSNLGKELCAFANASGGTIFIGVDDKGNIVGVKNHNKLKSEIQSTARAIEPTIIIDVKSFKEIVCITVPEQNGKPYSFAGKFYIREGASSQQLTRNEIREFFFKEGIIRFDEMENNKFNFKTDLTDKLYRLFSKKAKIPEEIEKVSALENLHLIKKNRMTNAGAFLLAKDIRKFSISATAMCAVFMGETKVKILDTRELTGDLYSIYQGIITYLQEKLNTEFIITGRGRIEKLELPEDALREAVVNAIAHRDYRSNAIIQVQIFHDRVEIINPGGLPAGMTPELLEKKSIPRNSLIFSIFHRMGMVEKLGSGIKRIKRLCKESGISEPKIDINEDWFTVIFKRKNKKKLKKNEKPTKSPTKLPTKLKKLIVLLKLQVKSTKELMLELNLKHIPTFRENYLQPAIKSEYVEYTIPERPHSKSQKYRITEKGKQIIEISNFKTDSKLENELNLSVDISSKTNSKKQKPTKSPTKSPTKLPTKSPTKLKKLLVLLKSQIKTAKELMLELNLKHIPTFRENYLQPAIKDKYIEYTIPEKPNSRLQKYRITEKGKQIIINI